MASTDPRKRGALLLGALILVSCSTDSMHTGRMPFTLLEFSPRAEMRSKVAVKGEPLGFAEVAGHDQSEVPSTLRDEIECGDVVAFYMSHRQALGALSSGRIQKVPYELFQYGHLAVVVPDPSGSGEKRLLQVAMNEPVNVDEGLDYLDDKRWRLFRPPPGSVDVDRLEEFTRIACQRADDPKRAYDYAGVLGWKNAPWQPDGVDSIGERYSCTTLVVAALHYSGFELDAVHRNGRLDIVTPRQVVRSRGWER